LIGFDLYEIAAVRVMNLGGGPGITMERIQGDVAAGQRGLRQQGAHGGHFAALGATERLMGQEVALLMGAREHHLLTGRAAERFAINGVMS
jgi:hypothetical protein